MVVAATAGRVDVVRMLVDEFGGGAWLAEALDAVCRGEGTDNELGESEESAREVARELMAFPCCTAGDRDWALRGACQGNQRALIDWLIKDCGVVPGPKHLGRACAAGHWDLALYLLGDCGLASDKEAVNCGAVFAIEGGKRVIARSLVRDYGADCFEGMLMAAGRSGLYDEAAWLLAEHPVCADGMANCLVSACCMGHWAFVSRFIADFMGVGAAAQALRAAHYPVDESPTLDSLVECAMRQYVSPALNPVGQATRAVKLTAAMSVNTYSK